jgi:tRNA pseudouridine38-40 synthase
MRYLIQLAYKGTNYNGWQKQLNAKTVQQTLDEKLSMLIGTNIETLGCGRTDTGVHASNFYAHFDAEWINDCHDLVYKLNKVLPKDIAIYDLFQVKEDFNARFDALWREYEYHIINKPSPFLYETAWLNTRKIDLNAMNEAAQVLFEYLDFECFSKVHTQVKTFNCKIMKAEWAYIDDHTLVFTIRADRFLRNMVRAIVGTLLDVGYGKISIQEVINIIESKNRSEAGQSVPACGLSLCQISYGENNGFKL